MNRIRKGDEVIVLTGKDKGRRGVILKINTEANTVLVEGINLVKKHVKPNPIKNTQGGIIEQSMPLHISNVSLVDASGKPSRVGIRVENEKKVRYLKTTNVVVAG